jgi:hypothetical protein
VENVLDIRKDIRTNYTPKLPKYILSYPSGNSLRDVYKKFALEWYKEEYNVIFHPRSS